GLKKGLVIDADFLKVLLRADGDARALARALYYLGYRARSENEVRQKLQEKEFPDAVINRVLQQLRENNLLNDAAFAQSWIENRTRIRPHGARILQQELRQKGNSSETINAALPDENEELINAMAALQKILQSKERLWADFDEKTK